jgi:hypothetical protein
MLKIMSLLVCLHIVAFSASLDALELKHNWSIKKVQIIEKIIKKEHEEFKFGLVTMSDLMDWNHKLFKSRKEKLNIEYEFKVKNYPKNINNVDFEDDINYVSAMLNISIQQVNFFEKLLPFVKSAMEVGQMTKSDLDIFELGAMEAYSQYDYVLKLYKDHTKTKIPYKLPSDIVKVLKTFK